MWYHIFGGYMRKYLCIDLKSFYASVECSNMNLDPFTTNLVVSDETRGMGAITLAITPALKKLGVKNRCRLYEIPSNIKYIIAKPQMSLYIKYSAMIYGVYLKYFSKEDMHVYSIDEVFIDITTYISLYNMTEFEIAKMVMNDVFKHTSITSTCGIGTNLYLAKIALDIIAKIDNTNIGYLDESLFVEKLSKHTPLTDFWQIGSGIETRLNKLGIYNMKQLSNYNEEILYKEFGINAKLLIDHAKGLEDCTIEDIKKYVSKSRSISVSQTFFKDYNYKQTLLVLKEMLDDLTLQLVKLDLVSTGIKISIGYSLEINKTSSKQMKFDSSTNRFSVIVSYLNILYDKTVIKEYPIRKLSLSLLNVRKEEVSQLDLFDEVNKANKEEELLKTIANLKSKHGKNQVLRAISLESYATAKKRNKLIGGHNEK